MNCPFYFKIGVCCHGDRCSRLHNRPIASQTLLLVSMNQSPDAGFHGDVDDHGDIQQFDPRKFQEHFEYVSVTSIFKANGFGVIDPGSEDDNVISQPRFPLCSSFWSLLSRLRSFRLAVWYVCA